MSQALYANIRHPFIFNLLKCSAKWGTKLFLVRYYIPLDLAALELLVCRTLIRIVNLWINGYFAIEQTVALTLSATIMRILIGILIMVRRFSVIGESDTSIYVVFPIGIDRITDISRNEDHARLKLSLWSIIFSALKYFLLIIQYYMFRYINKSCYAQIN